MSVVDRWAVSQPGSAFATRFMGRPDTAHILRSTPTSTAGGWAQDFVEIGTCPCRLTTSPQTVPSEVVAAGQLASITHWLLNVPPDTDIIARDRVTVQGVTFEVLGGYQAASWNIADTYVLAEVQH